MARRCRGVFESLERLAGCFSSMCRFRFAVDVCLFQTRWAKFTEERQIFTVFARVSTDFAIKFLQIVIASAKASVSACAAFVRAPVAPCYDDVFVRATGPTVADVGGTGT